MFRWRVPAIRGERAVLDDAIDFRVTVPGSRRLVLDWCSDSAVVSSAIDRVPADEGVVVERQQLVERIVAVWEDA